MTHNRLLAQTSRDVMASNEFWVVSYQFSVIGFKHRLRTFDLFTEDHR